MCRILIVDDSTTMRAIIERALTDVGFDQHDIGHAGDGIEALQAIELSMPELVISDVNMPRMTGTQLLSTIQGRYGRGAPTTVMVTSVPNSSALVELFRLGAAKVIRKPFAPSDLPRELGPFLPPLVRHDPWSEPTLDAPPTPQRQPGDDFVYGLPEDAVREALVAASGSFFAHVATGDAPAGVGKLDPTRVVFIAEVALDGGVRVRLSTTRPVSARLAVALTGAPPGQDDRACLDAIAEAANIIVGGFMRELAERGVPTDDFAFGLPVTDVVAPGRYEPTNGIVHDLGRGEIAVIEILA